MKKYQKQVDDWVKQYQIGYFKPLEILTSLMEEVGELAKELNHNFGPKKKKKTEKENEIAGELGDVIFTLICLSNSLGIDMDKSITKTLNKIKKRDDKRFEKK